uniref:Transcription elongation regulator 1 like n=1 Tax=Malurus cyaneus samueli TaxID=2593467 RepID=A0A8C5U305_9PASS
PCSRLCSVPSRWIFGAHSPVVGFSPSSSVEFVPVFPPVYTATVPPHAAKSWMDKRLPNCKIYLHNAFALDSAWIPAEESCLLQGAEKPLLLSNQVAMAVARPATASRPLPTLVLAPQLLPGAAGDNLCAVMSLSSAGAGSVPPHAPQAAVGVAEGYFWLFLVMGSSRGSWLSLNPLLSTDPVTVLVCGPGAALCFTCPCPCGSASSGNKPVASAPVPGSPWCVVWTGDDRVFFFNPSMQLSVWERPLDLRHRGDLKRLLQDPPHKRKLEPAATRGDGEEWTIPSCPQPCRVSPQVSAFSTWEKELHKMVFDPRYLLLNPEERKQIFEQFVKTRIREEYKEKKNKLLLAKEEFKKLLEESKLSPRTTFKEFAEKHGRDQRFRLVPKKKDQEHFFNQFILILKKRDKENRIRLRKMR